MTTEFELEQGRNRALVVYYCGEYGIEDFKDVVENVFEINGVLYDELSDATEYRFQTPRETLNIALEYAETVKRLKVGGEFETVNVGVFFYDQPAPPEPEIDPDDDTVLDDEPEPEPPSLTELICSALQNEFGGVYGASSFVIPNTVNDFILRVE